MILLVIFTLYPLVLPSTLPKIGIIGGGIGGTGAAYYLRTLFGSEIDITLFEANKVGGRLSTTTINERNYETGGSIFLDRNKYVFSLLKQFGFEPRKSSEHYSSIYNGREIIFSASDWSLVNMFELLWRYGWGLITVNRHIGDMLNKFDRIYELQDNLVAFENVSSLLLAMDPSFLDELSITAKEGFEREGVSKIVIDELVAGSLRVNYGQSLSVHKFVGSVSVAGVSGGLKAVDGGNKLIPEKLLKVSGARKVMMPVVSVALNDIGRFSVTTEHKGDINDDNSHIYSFDAVIIATPQTHDSLYPIQFLNLPGIKFDGRYHRTVATILRGTLNREYFPQLKPITDEIFTISESVFFNSISRIDPVDYASSENDSNVYKIFSNKPLSDSELQLIFSSVEEKTVSDWLAYPQYETTPRNDQFLLAPGLYHINAIEWAASAMEMSLIGARNVANLFRRDWCAVNSCDSLVQNHLHEL